MGYLTKQDAIIILVGVVVSLFLIFVAVLLQLSQPVDMHQDYVHPEDAYKYMQTGDILTVSYNNLSGKLVRVFTGSVWTHSGLVVESDGYKFVVEVAIYRGDVRGVVVKPLEDWFNWNKSRLLGWRPYRGKNAFPHQKVLDIIKKDTAREINPDMNSVSWLKTLVKRRHNDENYGDRTKYYCSEYIIHLLQSVGVVRKDYLPDGYKPWELLYGDMPYIHPHEYGRYYLIGDPNDIDAEASISAAPDTEKKKKLTFASGKPGSKKSIPSGQKPGISEEKRRLLERTRERVRQRRELYA